MADQPDTLVPPHLETVTLVFFLLVESVLLSEPPHPNDSYRHQVVGCLFIDDNCIVRRVVGQWFLTSDISLKCACVSTYVFVYPRGFLATFYVYFTAPHSTTSLFIHVPCIIIYRQPTLSAVK